MLNKTIKIKVIFLICVIVISVFNGHRAMHFILHTTTDNHESTYSRSCSGNKEVVYGTDTLQEELLKVHYMLYTNKTEGECILRDPKAVVIGVAKGGTRELVDFASFHPNIISKPGYSTIEMFHKDKKVRRKGMKGDKPMPCSYADQIVISKADSFLSLPEMPKMLHTFNPDLKMILMVREPIERMVSHYSFDYLQKLQHKEQFIYKLESVPEIDNVFVDASGGSIKDNWWLEISKYYLGFERYLKVFPANQILVIEANELRKDPVKVLQRLEKFLNLQPVFTNAHFDFVEEKGFYCFNNGKLFCYGSDRGRTVLKELRPETRARLKSYFKPHNLKFFEQIGRKFDW